MDKLVELVKKWGREHKIDNPMLQYAKVNEEIGEIAHELTRNNYKSPEMVDALGDSLVTLIILADILGYDLKDCLETTYKEISHRKGETINGCFVKDDSPQ